VREDAALQERVELVLHELRQVGPGGIFPKPASCPRLVSALCAEIHGARLAVNRYTNKDLLNVEEGGNADRLMICPTSTHERQYAQLDKHNLYQARVARHARTPHGWSAGA
jgi:hypothetical protein